MKRPHDQMIRQQRRIGKGKAAAHAGRSPSRDDGRCRKFHVDPATFLVSVVWVVGKRIARASSIACLTPRCAEAPRRSVGGLEECSSCPVHCCQFDAVPIVSLPRTTSVTGSPPVTHPLNSARIDDSGARARSPIERTLPINGSCRVEPIDYPFADQFRVPDAARFRHRANRVRVIRCQMDRDLGVEFENAVGHLLEFVLEFGDVCVPRNWPVPGSNWSGEIVRCSSVFPLAESPLFFVGHWPSRDRVALSVRKLNDHAEQVPASIGLPQNVVNREGVSLGEPLIYPNR